MLRFRHMSIKRKMMSINLAIVSAALLLTGTVLAAHEFVNFRRSLVQDLTVQAGIIANHSTAALAFNDARTALENLSHLSGSPNIVYAIMYTKDGRPFADYQRGTIEGSYVPSGPQKEGYWFGFDHVSMFHRILLDGDFMGTLYIRSDLGKLHMQLRWFTTTVVIVIALSLIISFIMSSKLQNTITAPLSDLVRLMRTISKNKDYSERAPIRSRDEIGSLAEGLNEMLDQIQKRDSELERHREHLEDLVTMRAAELAKTNEDLQQELAERKNAEERLDRYARELKESNEELKTYAYIASHDLRTPLVNMKGFAGELRYALNDISAAINNVLPKIEDNSRNNVLAAFLKDVPEALGYIDSSANRMDELITAIAKLSRLGHQELKFELFNVGEVVKMALNDLHLVIEKNGIKVRTGPLPEIVADKSSLQVIFSNLLENSVKYMRPGVPGKIEISAEQGAEETTFSVRDNGRGIPEKDIPKIFEMFRQVGEQERPGDGMGLAYTKILVRRHGGRIWCESRVGLGSGIYFTIPKKRKSSAPAFSQ